MLLTHDHLEMLGNAATVALSGSVLEARGLAIRVADLPAPVGASVEIHARRDQTKPVRGEVVGFDRDDTIGSISMLHESGINATLALGDREGAGDYRYGKLGYIGNWFSAGTTALSVDYYDGADTISVGSSSESLGIGVVQKVDSANLEVYLGYRTYELNETTATYQDASSVPFGTWLKF